LNLLTRYVSQFLYMLALRLIQINKYIFKVAAMKELGILIND
jgi:hypothetical protein